MESTRPWPNTYWVRPGRLLAGEYPGAHTIDKAKAKLGKLIDAGVDSFIDLTESHELEPYEAILQAEAAARGRNVQYRRMPIRDVSVPDTAEYMGSILDAIDEGLAEGRNVYVHCWGGVGRTGTVIGCHLARHGMPGDAALEQVGELFGAMAKSATKVSPESAEQRRWVRDWKEPVRKTVAMPIPHLLGQLRTGDVRSFRHLSVVPLLQQHDHPARAYLTFKEALDAGTIRITEATSDGSVPTLLAINDGALAVLLVDGEELVGAKQNRVVNLSILVAAKSTIEIPVSCVEQGRWGYAGHTFHDAGRAMFGQGRAHKSRAVSNSMRTSGSRAADQGEVWRQVSEKLSSLEVGSPTMAMSAAYEQRSTGIEDYVRAFGAEPRQSGAIFAIDGVPVGIEVFDSPDTFELLLPKLLRSYALDVLHLDDAGTDACSNSAASEFLSRVGSATTGQFPGVGLGRDLRIEDPHLTGGALVLEDRIVHLTVFDSTALDRAVAQPVPRTPVTRNQLELRTLLAQRKIHIERADMLFTTPSRLRLQRAQLWDRIEGMLLGLAIGDSLGNRSESMLPVERSARFGEIRDYLPHPHAEGRAVGLPSDDTQLAFWTLRRLIEDDGLLPEHLAGEFSRHRIFGIGKTVRSFITNHKDRRQHWTEAGPESAGNGSLMRIAPVLIPHLNRPSAALWADTALAAMITHNDPAAIGSCVAFVHLLWELLNCESSPEPSWWASTFTRTLREVEGASTQYVTRTPHIAYQGPLWRFLETQVPLALAADVDTRSASDRWYSGAYLLETVPSALYILARHGHDPEEAIVRAVNDTRDNDTTAAIVGAAVGALHGKSALPERWVTGLLGRTHERDDGAVFELMRRARDRWS